MLLSYCNRNYSLLTYVTMHITDRICDGRLLVV